MMMIGVDGARRIRQQVSNDPTAQSLARKILQQAEDVHASPALELEFEAGRSVILPTSRKLLYRVTTLGVAAIIDGRNDHRFRALSEMKRAADFDNWNPGHFLDAAEMMTAMALGLDWFQTLMSQRERHAIETAIIEKGLNPGLSELDSHAFWTTATHNWNVVCCGGLIIAAISLRTRNPQLCESIIQRASEAIKSGLSAFTPDGGYEEGPGYWDYAIRYAVLVRAAMQHAGIVEDHPASLLSSWRYGAATTGPSGSVFNYGDTAEDLDRSPVLGWLALQSADADAAFWQHAAPGNVSALDLLWFAPAEAVHLPRRSVTTFQKAGISVLRTGGDSELYLALKGGRNDVNHAHLDLGTFILEIGPARIACELGREDYALPGYFEPAQRFGYFRTTTAAHNTLLIDGRNQSVDAKASLIGTRSDLDVMAVAYRIEDPFSPVFHDRGVRIDKSAEIVIVDELCRRKSGVEQITVEWRMFTRADVDCDGKIARLSLGDTKVALDIAHPIDAIWVAEEVLSPPGMADNSAFTCLRFAVTVAEENVRIAVMVRRVNDWASPSSDHGPIETWGLGRN